MNFEFVCLFGSSTSKSYMNFFIFLDGQITHVAKFTVSTSLFDTPIQTIIDCFAEDVKKNVNDMFDPSRYNVYIDDHSDLTSSRPPTLLENLENPISTLEGKDFDLILSLVEPLPTHQQLPEVDESPDVIQQQMFDEAIQQAKMALANRDFKTANYIIQKARKLNKDDPTPLHLHVILYMKLHRFKMAIEYSTNATRIFPTDKTALMLSARAHQRAGLHDEAIELYKRVFLFSPHNTTEYDEINLGIARSLLALEYPDQALSLVKPIVNSNPLNLKATVLMGKILARQGRLAEGLHYVIRNFSIEPDHKASRKFIGEHVFNERQAELLRAELGDGIQNPFIMFYVAHILNEYGSCGAAQYFFMHAVKELPSDASVAVGCIKNCISICIEPREVLEIANSFIPYIEKRTDSLSALMKDFDLTKLEKDFDSSLTKPIPAKQCVAVGQGTEKDANFKIEQYDTIWFTILLEGFLFARGFITAAETLVRNVQQFVGKYNFSKTVISAEIQYHLYIASLVSTIERPLIVKNRFYVIGDEHCLSLAWRTINFKGSPYVFVPIVIENLHPTSLSSSAMSVARTSFWSSLRMIPENSKVVFCTAEIDSSSTTGSTGSLDRGESQTIEEALSLQIESLLRVTHKISADRKCQIWVHPMHYMPSEPLKTIVDFNDKLARLVWFGSKEHPNVRMIDIFDQLVTCDKDGAYQFKQEYFIDNGWHLSPNYLKLVEESLNNDKILLDKHMAKFVNENFDKDMDEIYYEIDGRKVSLKIKDTPDLAAQQPNEQSTNSNSNNQQNQPNSNTNTNSNTKENDK